MTGTDYEPEPSNQRFGILPHINSNGLLRVTLLAGLILIFITGVSLLIFHSIGRNASAQARRQNNFSQLLSEYDMSLSVFYRTEREYDQLHLALDRLEKNAIGVESWLSILKRRRALTLSHPPSLVFYHRSIDRALDAFPASQQIAAIAAAAIVKDSKITSEDETRLRALLSVTNDPSFNSLCLSIHILIGDFKDPQSAAVVSPNIASDGSEALNINLAVLKIIRGDKQGSAADIQRMMNIYDNERLAYNMGQIEENSEQRINREQFAAGNKQLADGGELFDDYIEYFADGSDLLEIGGVDLAEAEKPIEYRTADKVLRFAAEFYYDFGDLSRSAEIFSFLNDPSAMSRQADALYLAGFDDSAKYIWNMLASQLSEAKNSQDDSLIVTALYNLAIIALEQNDLQYAASYLERLNNIKDSDSNQHLLSCRQFGLIRFSRMQELPRAAALLRGNSAFPPQDYPYIDLEICKRLSSEWNLNRQAAETWLLLDRHPENEDLYKWAAWSFFFQRRYDEIPILIDRINLLHYMSSWANLYKAILLMNEGYLENAETILLSIPEEEAEWPVNANLGRIYDEMLSHSRAIRQYETAVKKQQETSPQNKKTAARLQQRIARGYSAQGKQSDALRAMLQALDLDPDNMSIRLELERMVY